MTVIGFAIVIHYFESILNHFSISAWADIYRSTWTRTYKLPRIGIHLFHSIRSDIVSGSGMEYAAENK